MFTIYAVKCRQADLAAIRTVVDESGTVIVGSQNDPVTIEPLPDVVFVGWSTGLEDLYGTNEEQRLRTATATAVLLTRIQKDLSFQDIPVLVLADEENLADARKMLQFGATGILKVPLEARSLRKSLVEATKPAGHEAPLDAGLVNPFAEATVTIIERMAGVEVSRNEVFLKKNYFLLGEVSAILEIEGKNLNGSVGLTFQGDLAREIVARVWGEDPETLTPESVNDGLGELVNIISGEATAHLSSGNGPGCSLSLPRIVSGYGNELAPSKGSPCLAILFETLERPFAIQVVVNHT